MTPHIIRDEAMRARVSGLIAGLDLKKPWAVTVEPHKERRSLSQNSLLWLWHEAVSDHSGHTPEEIHEFIKHKFLAPKSIEINGEVREIWTTKPLNTTQMKDFMDAYYAWAASDFGLLLPVPEELGVTR